MNISKIRVEHCIEGRELPQDEPPRCAKCSARLREGQPISAAVERTDESWTVVHLWDVGCAPTSCESVAQPVLVEGDIAAVADAAHQRHYPVLAGVAVVEELVQT